MKIRQFAAIALQTTILLLVSSTAQPTAAQTQPILSSSTTAVPDQARVSALLRSSPVMFIENVGQFADGARFQMRGGNSTIWFADDAIWITAMERSQIGAAQERLPRTPERPDASRDNTPRKGVNLKMSFVGANAHFRLEPFNRLDTHISYFIGNEPKNWHADVPVWGGVRYKDLYPGIDLEMTSENGQMVQRIVARAGANLNTVRLRIDGADKIALDGERLRVTTAAGEYTMPLLQSEAMPPNRVALNGNVVAAPFTNSPVRNSQLAMVTSSEIFYSTFLGGSASEYGNGIAVDASGAAYVTGYTYSTNFPTTAGAFQTTLGGEVSDAFVTKLNVSGSGLVYSTFLGGSSYDQGYGIAVDSSGAAYVTGQTASSNFPTTAGAFQTTLGGGWGDAFVTKLNVSGSGLVYSTFLGGSGDDTIHSIAVDASGSAYVMGTTFYLSNFPTTAGAFQTTLGGGGGDAFVTKLNVSGSGLAYSTFLGGSGAEWGDGIAVDASGAAYVTGYTYSTNFPTTAGAFHTTIGGSSDAFVTKLNVLGSGLVYSTFLGGSVDDTSKGIAVDSSGAAYVTGYTYSSNFPTTVGALQTTLSGNPNAFVTKLNVSGSGLVYSTFLGGSSGENGNGIAVDSSGAAYVIGITASSNFPTTAGAFQTAYSDYRDAFVTKLNVSGSGLVYSTFLGGSFDDNSNGIAVDASGAAYVSGDTGSTNFPTTAGAFQTTGDGAFVTKLPMGNTPTTYSISGRVADGNGNPISDVTISDGAGHTVTTDSNGNYTLSGLAASTYTITPTKSGYTFSPGSRTMAVPPNGMDRNFTGTPLSFGGSLLSVYPASNSTASTVMQGGTAYRYFRLLDENTNPIANATITFSVGSPAISDASGYFTATIPTSALGGLGSYQVNVQSVTYGGQTYSTGNQPAFGIQVTDRRYSNAWSYGASTRAKGGVSAGLVAYLQRTASGGLELKLDESNPDITSDDVVLMKEDFSDETGAGGGVGIEKGVSVLILQIKGGAEATSEFARRTIGSTQTRFSNPYSDNDRKAEACIFSRPQ